MMTEEFHNVLDVAAQTLITADIHNLQDLGACRTFWS